MPLDHRFYRIVKGIKVDELARRLGALLYGKASNPNIIGIAPFHQASKGDLTFQTSAVATDVPPRAGSIIISNIEYAQACENGQVFLVVDNPRKSFAEALNIIVDTANLTNEKSVVDKTAVVHPNACIAPGAIIGARSHVGSGAVIQAGVVIGCDCHIGSNTVLSHCCIGNNVSIGAGTIIGDCGFGFEMTGSGSIRLPHVGIVYVADGCCIGSLCAIDRGSLSDTVIGKSVMIDNLCHIAHNVRIGDRAVIAGQCGLSGSAVVGSDVQMGGQVGIAPHVSIGDGAVLTARSGVTKDVASGCQVAGFPAIEAGQFWRGLAFLRRSVKASRDVAKDNKNYDK